jgi:hypothetical protein
MESDGPRSPPGRVRALMWNLRIDAALGEVVDVLRRRGIDSVVLKGPTFSDWYPRDSARTYRDGDLWVAPKDVQASEAVLADLGFVPSVDQSRMPEWWQEHAMSWQRERDQAKIDLHRRLQGVEANDERAWSILWAEREQLTIGGIQAYRLSEPARALYATLHATHHGLEDPRGLQHLGVALSAVSDQGWARALRLAQEVDAVAAFATGLRLMPAGVDLAARLGVPDSRSVKAALLASSPPPIALGFEQIAAASGRGRVAILLRKFVPPAGFIRHWWPPAARNRGMLLIGYLYRPIWLLKHAPAGYRAWRAARRDANSSS